MIAKRLDMSEIVQQLLDSGAKQHLIVSNVYAYYRVCFIIIIEIGGRGGAICNTKLHGRGTYESSCVSDSYLSLSLSIRVEGITPTLTSPYTACGQG